jgi:hypothetical protein
MPTQICNFHNELLFEWHKFMELCVCE